MLRSTCGILSILTLLASGLAGQTPAIAPGSAPADNKQLQPGDVIKLVVWREPDYTGEFPIHPDGTVVLPLVGSYQTTGETAETLRDRVRAALSVNLRDPVIDIIVERRVKITGAVHRPGLYPVDATMTIGDALATAGGATPGGRRDRIILIREGRRLPGELTELTRLGDSPLQSGDEIFVPERNFFARNYGLVLSAVTTILGLYFIAAASGSRN